MKTLRFTLLAAAALAALPAHAQNLVLNPGFENTGDPDPVSAVLTDWSTGFTGNFDYLYPRFSGVYDSFQYPWISHTGQWSAAFGAYANSSDTLYQDVPTVSGRQYRVSFYVDQWFGVVSGSFFSSTFGGTTVNASTLGDSWVPVSYTVTATSSTTRLSFLGGGLASDHGYYMLDDVSVQAVPEPSVFAAMGLGAIAVLRRRGGRREGRLFARNALRL